MVTVVAKDTPLEFDLVAQLRGLEDVEIRARVEGYLETIDYAEGSTVKKGKLLFTIDDQQYVAALAQAQATLASAQNQFDKADLDVKRFTPLAAERAVSQAELDNAISARKSGAAQMEAGQGQPREGAPQPLLHAHHLPHHRARRQGRAQGGRPGGQGRADAAHHRLLHRPHPRQRRHPRGRLPPLLPLGGRPPRQRSRRTPPVLILSDGTQHPYPGKLIFVDRAVDTQTGTLRVDLAFPNPKKTLRPGLYGKVKAESEVVKGALLVPQRAVQELQGTYTVVVVGAGRQGRDPQGEARPEGRQPLDHPGRAEERRRGWWSEGFQRLRDGMTIVPKPAAAPAPAASPAPAGGK